MGWVLGWDGFGSNKEKGREGRDGCFFLTRDVDIVIGEGVVSDVLFLSFTIR